MSTATDQNGSPVFRDERREGDGTWTVCVWVGDNPAHHIRRYRYRIRAAARRACVSDALPQNNVDDFLEVIQ